MRCQGTRATGTTPWLKKLGALAFLQEVVTYTLNEVKNHAMQWDDTKRGPKHANATKGGGDLQSFFRISLFFFSKCAAILFCMHFCVVCGNYVVDSYVYIDILVFTKIRVQVIKLIEFHSWDMCYFLGV